MVQMKLFARQERDTDVENGHVDMVGGKGSGMNWEIGIGIYTLPCVK